MTEFILVTFLNFTEELFLSLYLTIRCFCEWFEKSCVEAQMQYDKKVLTNIKPEGHHEFLKFMSE